MSEILAWAMSEILAWAGIWNVLIQILSNLAVAFSVVFVALTYIAGQKRSEHAVSMRVFTESSEVFSQLSQIMLQNIDIPISIYHHDKHFRGITEEQRIRAYIVFDIQTTAIERVFFLFLSAPSKIHRDGWNGWDHYIGLLCKNPLFREWWFAQNYGYSAQFSAYLTDRFNKS